MRANNLGVAYLNQQKLDQALKEFQEVVAADKDNASGQLNLGIALLNLGRVPQAEAALQRAAQLDAKNPAVPYNLGLLHRNNGQAEQAKPDFERFQKLTREKLGSPISQIYGEQGPLSLARVIPGQPPVPAAIPVKFAVLGPESGLPTASAPRRSTNAQSPGPGICVFDL